MQAVILAGGKGTRLQSKLGNLPKSMVDICGRPLLEWQIDLLKKHGFNRLLLLLGYNPDPITEYFGDGSGFGVSIEYAIEPSPLGSAGALLSVVDRLEERFLVLYGDTMLNADLRRFWETHAALEADASLLTHPNDHPGDSDLVAADQSGSITGFHPVSRPRDVYYPNLVNAALYVMERRALTRWSELEPPLDLARDVFPLMIGAGQKLFAYRSREYVKDAGTPERLEQVERDQQSGRVASASLATPAPAVFLDRDGTINEEVSHISKPSQFRLLAGVGEAIRKLNRSGRPVVVITNQPVVARGECTEPQLLEIMNKMETQLGEAGAYVNAIYYCPHHPDKGFAGERPELKFQCDCRKPASGLIDRACREMSLDPGSSWFIGDSETDVRTAARAGVRSILVETGLAGTAPLTDCSADYRFPTLAEAVDFLLAGRA